MVRKGFTFIELVVSIVVIGIAFMSIPILLESSSKSDEFSTMQESVLMAKTKIQNITTYRWDENSLDPVTGKVYILDTSNSDSELQRFDSSVCSSYPFPLNLACIFFWNWFSVFFPNGGLDGQIVGDGRRKMFDSPTYPNISEVNLTNPNDVDDFNGEAVTSLVNQEGTDLDYLNRDNFDLNVTVGYVSDNADYSAQNINFNFADTFKPAGEDSNIKMIEIRVSGVISPFVLRYYSCNIGESDILKRTFF